MLIPNKDFIPFLVRLHAAADYGPTRSLSKVTKFIVHDTQGGKFGDEEVLTSPAAPVESAHALIWPSGETIITLDPTVTAWTPGNDDFAEVSINVEMTGYDNEQRTEAQYQALAGLFRFYVSLGCPIPAVYVGRSGAPGILGHKDVPDPDDPGLFGGVNNHTDPGPLFDWNKLITLIKQGGPVDRPTYQPIADFVADNGGEAVFGPATSGVYGTNGSVEQDYYYAHLYLDKATGKVVPQMKPRENPSGKSIGPGVLAKLRERGLEAITNEQYFRPAPGQVLGERSFTWAKDATGKVFQLEAFQEIDGDGKPTGPWPVRVLLEG